MQLFFGTCLFFIAVVLLAYMPGKLLLVSLRRTLGPLEDVTLACFLGLIVSGLVYWLITFTHQSRFYFIWPLATGAVFILLHGRTIRSLLRRSANLDVSHKQSRKRAYDRSLLVFAGIVALGVIALAFLPIYYTNLTSRADGTMHVYPVPDVLFHIAVANELTHTIPPQAPHFSGHPLAYHYAMDLVVAMFAKATGLSTVDLTVRFVPTLLLVLSMLSVFCFSRNWLGSGYFGALVVFLVFFGEDLSFIPGLLRGEDVDWSLRYFSVPPAVFPLFYTNPILPGLGLLFAGLLCLRRYLSEAGGAWLFVTALLFAALVEVKIFTAAQLMASLGFAAVVYLVFFRKTALIKIAACTAALATPLVFSIFLQNRGAANMVTKFEPGLYISQAMEAIGMKQWSTGWIGFVSVAMPLYLVGTLGFRVIGVPALFNAIFRPNPVSALRFVLGIFVVIGVLLALLFSITPAGWSFKYNPVSGTFFIQSKYVAWIFAVEVLQSLYRWVVARSISSALTATGIVAIAAGLSVPSTLQHFIFWRNPNHYFGARKPFGNELQNYDVETLSVINFVRKDAVPGDVVLPGDNLLAPILALTKCRVPMGYFAYAAVARNDFIRREAAEKKFWAAWHQGNIQEEFLHEVGVRYIVVRKSSDGLPAKIPATISNVFENSEFAVLKVNTERLSETVPKSL
ncbi:MAG: hypothetical protein WA269_10455 [Candidatus Udaeobacter sp.]